MFKLTSISEDLTEVLERVAEINLKMQPKNRSRKKFNKIVKNIIEYTSKEISSFDRFKLTRMAE